jgi:hypothetical protein
LVVAGYLLIDLKKLLQRRKRLPTPMPAPLLFLGGVGVVFLKQLKGYSMVIN